MNEMLTWHHAAISARVSEALRENGMNSLYAADRAAALAACVKKIEAGDVIGIGGSVTLDEIGLVDSLRSGVPCNGEYTFLDQYHEGLDREEALALRHRSLTADLFFSGTNAITMDGELINMDGFGNRVAALSFGPKRVVIVAGINKIVPDVAAGLQRIALNAAPPNCRRLNRRTPCYALGHCVDEKCTGPDRICNVYSVIRRQPGGNTITVILVGESLGF